VSAGYVVPTRTFGSIDLTWTLHTSAVPLQPGAGDNHWGALRGIRTPVRPCSGRLAANLDHGHWTIAAWSKNIFNKNYFTYGLDLTASLAWVTPMLGRWCAVLGA